MIEAKTKLIAHIILTCDKLGIKLSSPYDLEEVGELLSNHSYTAPFFYENDEPINLVEKAKAMAT